MFAVTSSSAGVKLQDGLALLALARRKLGHMALATKAENRAEELRLGNLRGEIINHGSSYAAYCLALHLHALDLLELLKSAGVYDLTDARRTRAFNACVDGYTVYDDRRVRGKL